MTSTYHSSFSPFTIDLNEDQSHHPHQQLIICSKSTDHDVSSSSSSTYPTFFHPPYEEFGYHHRELQPLHHEEKVNIFASHGGSWDHSTLMGDLKNGKRISVYDKQKRRNSKTSSDEDHQREDNCSVKWMRFPRKMMCSSDLNLNSINTAPQTSSMHKFEDGERIRSASQEEEEDDDDDDDEDEDDDDGRKNLSKNGNNSVRVCSDCNTTKTPLWRSGPRGPKSLCNACGIRQRKARRAAMAAAEASSNGAILAPNRPVTGMKTKIQNNKEKKTSNNSHLPLKKRCKFTAQFRGSRKKLCFEDLSSIILSKNSTFQQVFPQDEKEAAILLMALSYGLVHG